MPLGFHHERNIERRNKSPAGPQPRWGCGFADRFPRVARSSQPWAGGRNPVGIQRWNFRTLFGPVSIGRPEVRLDHGLSDSFPIFLRPHFDRSAGRVFLPALDFSVCVNCCAGGGHSKIAVWGRRLPGSRLAGFGGCLFWGSGWVWRGRQRWLRRRFCRRDFTKPRCAG